MAERRQQPGIEQNITAKRGDPAFKQAPRPDVYTPGVDNPVTSAPVELIRQLLEHFLPIMQPQDVQLPSETGFDMSILDRDPRFAGMKGNAPKRRSKMGATK